MLLSLSIKNYALIENLEIQFSDKFSIITGETGAGKSILLGALGLVLGNRADLSSLKDDTQKCIIEAEFLISAYNLKEFFKQNDLDYEELTIIRREILPSGKSRAFVNDSPVNLSELQELGNYLLDIHSQHQTRELIGEDFQLNLLDLVSQTSDLLSEYKVNLKELKQSEKELASLLTDKESLVKEYDYNAFLLDELVKSNLKEGELEELEQEVEQLSNVSLIEENLSKIVGISNEETIGIITQLKEAKNSFSKIDTYSKLYKDLLQRLDSIIIEYLDIIKESEVSLEKLEHNPERLEFVNNKLQIIYSLFQKHQVNSVEDLLQIQEDLEAKVLKVDEFDIQIQKLEKQIEELNVKLNSLAASISQKRKDKAPSLATEIRNIISSLGMPDAQLEFAFTQLDSFGKNGTDLISLNFSANKGSNLSPIKKVASGGELSRVMLAIKAVLANYSKLPTIIFDEIDTGVSGEIAIKMAEVMDKMSDKMQVFAITHLPQIAAKGNQHYKVFKYNQGNTTFSEIKLLSNDDRIVEIAEMLSGKNISDSALTHAKNLLN
ncbi:DNA repair protein RecN [Flavobacterium haoranii]|uniref:DNA repair protein RecN n=1 Tax=Flavobacterium haoranii TaxID=683124 RepID=A0A1M6L5Y7_9FLAO|nr:DNA repair protein RecN [Flavobacterium haoranii]SHJ66643.1 DNA replication and repair protein RecN [Flavobacterium haoranii]